MNTTPQSVSTIAELRSLVAAARATGGRVAFVPTMGALHEGHLALVRRARKRADLVVVSIFVNPLQFGPTEDLERYPRTPEADVAVLTSLGVDVVFAPTVEEVYPDGPVPTRVTAGAIGGMFEGRSRPGHFDGMLTVVTKLLNIVQPDIALFGQKDAQQLFLVRRLVRDLNLPIEILAVPTEREPDGLALSSRNRFLGPAERVAARVLSVALAAASASAERGVDAVVAAAQSAIMGEALVKLDYLAIVDEQTFIPVSDDFRGEALVLIAARVGTTRLIDNAPIFFA
ncbi:MAG: pantoate--beta-alanine ligase [Microbacteriaceae bacterium]